MFQVPSLLEATVIAGMKLEWLGYTRKSLQFPQMQLFPHSSIGEEVTFLKSQCKLGCEAYVLGPITSDHWVAIVRPGRILYELDGVEEELAREAFRLAGHKLPVGTRFVTRSAEVL